MKLRQRILTTTVVTLILFALAIGIALFGMKSAQNRFQQFVNVEQALLQEQNHMYAQGLQMGQALRNLAIDPSNETPFKTIETASAAFDRALENARKAAIDHPTTLQLLASISSIRERHIKEQNYVLSIINNQPMALEAIRTRETPIWREMRTVLMESIERRQDDVNIATAAMQSTTQKVLTFSIITGLLGLIATSVLMFWLGRGILRQMGGEPDEALRIASAIAAGDFTQTICLAQST